MQVQVDKYNIWLTVKDPKSGSTMSLGVDMAPKEEGDLIVEFPGESPMSEETFGQALVDMFEALMPTCNAFAREAPQNFVKREDSF